MISDDFGAVLELKKEPEIIKKHSENDAEKQARRKKCDNLGKRAPERPKSRGGGSAVSRSPVELKIPSNTS